jgi:L-fuculose-phosphate aldolase
LSKYQSYKETVLQYSQRLSQNRYTVGTGGNISLLIEGENAIAITPTAMDYFGIHVDDICIVDFDMNILEGKLKPSIETKMHIEVYGNKVWSYSNSLFLRGGRLRKHISLRSSGRSEGYG